MPSNLIILIAALIVAFLIFKALLNVLKTFLSTAIAIGVIVVILMFFGFRPEDLMREVTNLPQTLERLFSGGK
ncbi:MAG: hypothetical protein SAK29_25220 [Scytonema sp. PMC 1069.18]|nr:hypothetical protein [Scytonema sp. PMC 1069.18]MEC4881168.1 hypothetical protein [Scytonema sp. PMC 1070.18]